MEGFPLASSATLVGELIRRPAAPTEPPSCAAGFAREGFMGSRASLDRGSAIAAAPERNRTNATVFDKRRPIDLDLPFVSRVPAIASAVAESAASVRLAAWRLSPPTSSYSV